MAHHLRWASTSKLTLTSTASSSSGLLSGQPGWRGNAPFTLPSSTRTLSTPTPAPVTLPFHASPRGISSAVGRQVAGGVNKPRLLHTTAPRRDHYSTLDISPQASQKDIKAQFYKLSKQFHPDRNQGSDDAKRKFQEVSEAYASLGTEANRKEYDRSLAARRAGGGGGGGGRNFRYASSDNSSRRARATYAWNYRQQQGRRDSQQHHQSRASSYHPHYSGSSASSGSGSGSSSSMFERFAARERRREAATQARQGTAAYKDSFGNVSPEEHHAQTASPVIRFLQVAGLFYVVFWVGTRLGGGSQTTKIKAEQEDAWEHRDSVAIRRC